MKNYELIPCTCSCHTINAQEGNWAVHMVACCENGFIKISKPMIKYRIKVTRKMSVFEITKFEVNADSVEEAKQLALNNEVNAKTAEDKGIVDCEAEFDYETLVPIADEPVKIEVL